MQGEGSANTRRELGRRIERMFSGIVPYYDFLNRVLSLGRDRYWRRELVHECSLNPRALVLDLAAGTLDVAREILRCQPEAWVVAVDFSLPMLRRGQEKLNFRERLRIWPVAADAYQLPFPDQTFDVLTIAFGLRNLPDRLAALAEMHRVIRPGGILAVLDFAPPDHGWPLRLYRLYLNHLLPRLGGLWSRQASAYRYLAESIASFPPPSELAVELKKGGFEEVTYRQLTAGIVGLFFGRRA